jgi:3-oxoacyl-[acyl-carrier protein] reductase
MAIDINYANSEKSAQFLVREIEQAGSKAFAIKADVSKVAEVARLLKEALTHFGRLDTVVF